MGLTYGGGAGQNVVTTEIKVVAPTIRWPQV